MKKQRKQREPLETSEKQKYRDEVLRIHVNCKSIDPVELTREQQSIVAEVSKYWLLKHGGGTIHIKGGEHYGLFAAIGIIVGIITMLVILYYLPV